MCSGAFWGFADFVIKNVGIQRTFIRMENFLILERKLKSKQNHLFK